MNKKIINLVKSEDYKERFIGEYFLIKDKKDRLQEMLEKWKDGKLDFTPTCDYNLLSLQLKTMESYLLILEKRAEVEKIALIIVDIKKEFKNVSSEIKDLY